MVMSKGTSLNFQTIRSREFQLRRGVAFLLCLLAAVPMVGECSAGAPKEAVAGSTRGFFVSPNGNDSNPGTVAGPFATLARAQQAMQRSSIKTTYVEGGTYNLRKTLYLTAADSGETWQYYPPNGVNSAVLEGGDTVKLVAIDGASNVTINGIRMQHFGQFAIYTPSNQRISGVTIKNCELGNSTWTRGLPIAAIVLDNAVNTKISNNYVHDLSATGIALLAYNRGDSIEGSVIENNVVLRTGMSVQDNGGIAIDMAGAGTSGGRVTIKNNYIADWGFNLDNARAVYLDDFASNVTVTGNILGPSGAASSSQNVESIVVHNGSNNTITDNIIDLGSSSHVWAVDYAHDAGGGQPGQVFANNIVISNFAGNQNTNVGGESGFTFFEDTNSGGSNPAWFSIHDNLYFNYGGGQARSDGLYASDTNPVHVNPLLSGWTYALASNSPAFSAINFKPIVGGWGPPGFVIPHTGTAPSVPH